ncbi:NAD(P)-dependent oxidoreductase [Bauldia litoralis]|uniref:D-3-phosphoglycerate dehydrogenase n=1 Tax=Bauldia litoralis TaxID=665467 RepID=A0A1G6AB33_9HYPH|nr:NAD(P)-dependent oxidoreductase [Bauldia litoralis]SDB05665.1 D-3-phosphoglycerate dehydrogenase [Bauldia litoralis]
MNRTLLVTCGHLVRHYQRFAADLEAQGIVVSIPPVKGQQLDSAEMCEAIVGQRLVIAGDDVIDRPVLEAGKASGLEAIIKWGIGTDGIDKPAAAELGIAVYNTPGVFSEEVADCAAGYVANLARGLHLMNASVRSGGWLKVEGMSLSGRTVGVIGLGGIGRATCRRLNAFGMTVIGYDPAEIDPALLAREGVTQASLDEVLSRGDFVVVTCALTPESYHLLSTEAFARMKDGVRLVNVARGPVVDEQALIAALESGKVATAALDVFETEPLPADSPLRKFEQLMFGTHNGSNTAEAVDRVNRLTVDLAFDLFGISGKPPRLVPLVAA